MKKFFPFLAYAILVLVVFWGVLWPPEGKILFGPDIWRYHYWQRQFLGESLKLGTIPWWNPYIFGGQPYLEHPQIPFWYLPNILFVLLPTNAAISWYIALHLFIAMSGMYCALRAMSNIKGQMSKIAAWGAGVAFGLSAYFVARIPAGHIDIIAASAWMPWVILAFSCSPRCFGEAGQLSAISRKNIAFAGVALAIQLLAGHPMVAVFTLEGVFIMMLIYQCYNIFQSFPRTRESRVKTGSPTGTGMTTLNLSIIFQPMVRVGAAILIGFGLAVIQLLPNAQFIAHSIRTFSFPDSWAQLGTPTVGHLLEFIDPFYFYSRLPDSGFGFEHVGYFGKVSLLFALLAVASWVVKKKTSWEIPAFVLVGIFGIWMWLGQNAPLDLFSWVRSWMPLYSQIRIPARHIVLFVLSASVLFGIGLSMVKSKILQVIVVGLLLLDLVPFARRHLSLVPIPEKSEDTALVSAFINDKSLYRFLPNFYHGDPLRDVLEFNAPIAHKIQSVSGYDTPPLRNMYEFLLAANGYKFTDVLSYSESTPPFRAITSPYLNYLNIKYILVPIASDAIKHISTKQFELVRENKNRGWRLYENKNVSPRFFIATKMQKEPNREAVLSAIKRGSVDPKTTIIVDGTRVDVSGFNPDCPADTKGTVTVNSYGYGKISLTAATPCNAFLATSEVMYPGWKATVDGKSTPIFESNAAFRTLYLPKGTHTIVFSYRPTIVLWGAAISILTILVIIFSFARPGLAKLAI
ncbi:MAG: YfhO family protein [Candidatus Gottesmanbacteria bacterium]|nr:YfhO family protein [Candidatus Gottesmanbacteria bacterium]